jgi:hypothetical protein
MFADAGLAKRFFVHLEGLAQLAQVAGETEMRGKELLLADRQIVERAVRGRCRCRGYHGVVEPQTDVVGESAIPWRAVLVGFGLPAANRRRLDIDHGVNLGMGQPAIADDGPQLLAHCRPVIEGFVVAGRRLRRRRQPALYLADG